MPLWVQRQILILWSQFWLVYKPCWSNIALSFDLLSSACYFIIYLKKSLHYTHLSISPISFSCFHRLIFFFSFWLLLHFSLYVTKYFQSIACCLQSVFDLMKLLTFLKFKEKIVLWNIYRFLGWENTWVTQAEEEAEIIHHFCGFFVQKVSINNF